jgi:hypothetical protein
VFTLLSVGSGSNADGLGWLQSLRWNGMAVIVWLLRSIRVR